MLLLGYLLPIFLKRITSLRKNNLKIRGFERGHSYQVPIGAYLGLILFGTWLGKSVAKEDQSIAEFAATDAAPDVETKPLDASGTCKALACYIADDRRGSSAYVAISTPRPLTRRRSSNSGQTQVSVHRPLDRRVCLLETSLQPL
jgi:hypothetical protein